jgi:GTP-binding protein Era
MSSLEDAFRSGYVAIIGLPNAGKSTLLNAMVGQKLSIVSPKVQTTRHRIAGFFTDERMQIVFLDTPGILEPRYALHRSMMQAVERSISEADVLLLLVEPWNIPQVELLSRFAQEKSRLLVVLNKIDTAPEEKQTEAVTALAASGLDVDFRISALQGTGLDELKNALFNKLPPGPPLYPEDQLSEHPERFFFSEFIREQVFLQTREEIPYAVAVDIRRVDESKKKTEIDADIICERESQKMILIGRGGETLKRIGIQSRATIEQFLGKDVVLKLFVKVRPDWRNNRVLLRSYGYE